MAWAEAPTIIPNTKAGPVTARVAIQTDERRDDGLDNDPVRPQGNR